MILLTSWVTVLIADLALSRIAVPAAAALLLALLALHGAGSLLRQSTARAPAGSNDVLGSARPGDRHGRPGRAGDRVRGVPGSSPDRCANAFPIALSVVCAFTICAVGHAGVLALLRGIVPGLDGFALFCFLVAILINRVGAAAAFALATAAAIAFALLLAIGRPAEARARG